MCSELELRSEVRYSHPTMFDEMFLTKYTYYSLAEWVAVTPQIFMEYNALVRQRNYQNFR